MGPFPSSYGKNEYILLAIDYAYKWVEAIPTRANDANVVMKFLRGNIIVHLACPELSLVTRIPTLLRGLLLPC